MLRILATEHSLPPDAVAAAKSLRDYASRALTIKTFVEHAIITLEDDPV
jgi:hypothetical protein